MAPKNRIILDTDPGVDDTMAMLLALSASPEDLELVLLSVTYGNVPLQSCLRNVVALFHVIEKEIAWREANSKPNSFESLKHFKPLVAVGPDHPLEEDCLMADYFHGVDGLHGVHEAHPDLSPADTWQSLFKEGDSSANPSPYFTPAKLPAHKEILRILREEPENTISICAVGPLTNIAMAAAEDPETFLRVKELVVMGGSVHIPGNITPVGEFNTYADAVAAARVYALTSPTPASTMPPVPSHAATLPPYPEKLSKQLKLSLCPLDITTPHSLYKSFFERSIKPHVDAGSPLARWIGHILAGTFNKITDMVGDQVEPDLSLHDPLTVWYMMTRDDPAWQGTPTLEDIRIETSGQWTRGMHLVDKRNRSKPAAKESTQSVENPDDSLLLDEVPGDTQGWLSHTKGNRINRIVKSPGEDKLAPLWMKQVFG